MRAQAAQPTDEQVASRLHPRPHLHNLYVAPRNEIEQTITSIWQNILGIDQIGIYDDFFALGGNSLLATQVASHLRRALQVDISLRIFLETTTVAELALLVVQEQAELVEQRRLLDLLEEMDRLSDDDVNILLSQS
jgi:acyl carrier protein